MCFSGAQKRYREKKITRRKKTYLKSFIFLSVKLIILDFKIFNVLKLLFTYESCLISFTE